MNSGKGEQEDLAQKNEVKKRNVKSCKGYVYYTSAHRSNDRDPRCFGISRTLGQVPASIAGKPETRESKDGKTSFQYSCVGYSVYLDGKDSDEKKVTSGELPLCVGLKIIKVYYPSKPAPNSAPVQARKREDGLVNPQPKTGPTHSAYDDILIRFTRNACVVAFAVARDMQKVGNHLKEGLERIFYPKRPK